MGKGLSRFVAVSFILAALGFFAFSHNPKGTSLWAGSMHWFEMETNSICRPSPVNRLVRPAVCLGFEKSLPLLARR